MKSLMFFEIKKNNRYILKDDKDNVFELCLEFYKIDKPSFGDKILIKECLLDKSSQNYCEPYSWELTNEYSPKQIKELDNSDYIVLRSKNKNFSLKRIYG